MRNVVVTFCAIFFLIQSPVQAAVNCRILTTLKEFVVKKPIEMISRKLAPPLDTRLMNAPEYDTLRNKTVGEYFPQGTVDPTGVAAFLKDFTSVAFNFPRMHLSEKGQLRKADEVESRIKSSSDFLFRNGFLEANRNRTLENLLLSENFEHGKPSDLVQPTVWSHVKRHSLGVAMLPVRFLKGFKNVVIEYGKWGLKNSVTAGTIGVVVGLAMDPVTNALSRYTNQHLGPLNVKLSLAISKLEGVVDFAEKMERTNDKLAEINTKFRLKEMSEEEAHKMWDDLEKTFLEYRREMYSVMKDNVASGRTYFRDGNISYPLLFMNSAMAANSEKMNHQQLVLLLENKKQSTGTLSPEEARSLEYHRNEVPKSEQRLVAALVAWKVHEFIYPEFSRAEFMSKHPSGIPMMGIYESFSKNFRMQDYALEFEPEMRRQLSNIGIPLREFKKGE